MTHKNIHLSRREQLRQHHLGLVWHHGEVLKGEVGPLVEVVLGVGADGANEVLDADAERVGLVVAGLVREDHVFLGGKQLGYKF